MMMVGVASRCVQYYCQNVRFARQMTNGIELKHLRHFMALAEELHFGRAARRCNISQPPFSVSIRRLESELGFPLVERSSHAVRLTAAGAAFYEEAGKALSQVRQASEVASRVKRGPLRLV